MIPTACPGDEVLQDFRLGRLAAGPAQLAEEHLRSCSSCLRRLPALCKEDALVRGLRAQQGLPRLRNPLLERVRQEILALPLSSPTPTLPVSTPSRTGATLWETSLPDSVPESTACSTQAFLAPSQGPGEMGRLGPYRVLGILGEGGMGVVLHAEDTRLLRQVAVKVMKPQLAADLSARQRFLREARATAALEHDNIITIHHIDEVNGVPYLAMPLLQGETLDARLRRESILPLAEVLRIGRETAQGLAMAHEKGLIHRDIKPSNLWLEAPQGRVKILDFGLASMPSAEGDNTLPGTILGTPGYMAPEQTEGQADARADLFSLGVVLYRMATGRLPFKGATVMQKLRSTLADTPLPPQEINASLPMPLCHLIMRLIARNPKDRPATALAVARVLETLDTQIVRGGAAPVAILIPSNMAPPSGATVPVAIPVSRGTEPETVLVSRPDSRRRLLIGGSVALAVLLLVVVIVWRGHARKDGPSQANNANPTDTRSENGSRVPGTSTPEKFPGRPGARGPRRSPTPPKPEEFTVDRSFTETWVTRPEKIEGLKAWCIESNWTGRTEFGAFYDVSDELLFVLTGSSWALLEPTGLGFRPPPFGGSFDAIARDGKCCLRVVQGGVALWEQGEARETFTLRSPGFSCAASLSPDGEKIVVFECDGQNSLQAHKIHNRNGDRLGTHHYSPGRSHKGEVWSPDSTTLAVNFGSSVLLFRAPWKEPASIIECPQGVGALAWSPNSERLAVLGSDQLVYVVNVETREIEDKIPIKVSRSDFRPVWEPRKGNELALATTRIEDKKTVYEVVVWNRAERKVTHRFRGHTRAVLAVAYHVDGKTLISMSSASLRFWDLENGRLRGSFLPFGVGPWLAISPEGYYRGSNDAEGYFVIRVRDKDDKRKDYPPEEFRKTFSWTNHPECVRLTGP